MQSHFLFYDKILFANARVVILGVSENLTFGDQVIP